MIIITGADGFIGQQLVLLAQKHFDRKELYCLTGKGKSILALRGKRLLRNHRIPNLSIDLLNKRDLSHIPKSPNLVIHLAANTDTASRHHEVNDLGTRNLFSALDLNSKTHFIYTSTTVLFSNRSDLDKPITQKTIPKPSNEYGRTKFAAEIYLKNICKKNNIPLTILRLNTVYGNDPREYKMFASLKNLILKKSIVGRLNWPGLTSIVHVDDVAEIIIKIAKKPSVPGKISTFLVYSENLRLSQISKLLHQALGKDYYPINLPKFFWKMFSSTRRFLPLLEKFLPTDIYNIFWRAGLIVDDVIYCKSYKLSKILPHLKMRKLKNYIKDTIT